MSEETAVNVSVESEAVESGDFAAEVEAAVVEPESTAPETQEAPAEKRQPTAEEKYENLKKALAEERRLRKENTERTRRMEAAFQEVMARTSGQAEKREPEAPDPEKDPVGYITHTQEQIRREVAEAKAKSEALTKEREQGALVDRLVADYRAHAHAFAAEQKDFNEAYAHLANSRVEELMDIGYTQAQAAQMAQQDELAIVAKALADGENPAQVMYKLAKRRGYTQKRQDNGAETILAAAKNSSPTAGARGDSPAGKMTLEHLATLEGDEFDKAWAKMFKSK